MALVHKQKALHAYCERSINQSVYRKNKRSEEYFHPYKFTPFIFFILLLSYFHSWTNLQLLISSGHLFFSFFASKSCLPKFLLLYHILNCSFVWTFQGPFFRPRNAFYFRHKFFCFWKAEFLFFLWNFYFHKMTFDGLKLSTTFETSKYCLHNSVNKPKNEEDGWKGGAIELIRVFAKKKLAGGEDYSGLKSKSLE